MKLNKPDIYSTELLSKIKILEEENETLLSHAEENLIINKIFREINNYEDLEKLLFNSLENISILLDVPFCGVFDSIDKQFNSISTYAIFQNEDKSDVNLKIKGQVIEQLEAKNTLTVFGKDDFEILIDNRNNVFAPQCFVAISNDSAIYANQFFILALDSNYHDFEPKIPLLKKIISIITVGQERICYHNEMQRFHNELQVKNNKLESTNKILEEKNQIINEQNGELKSSLEQLKKAQAQLVQAEKMASLGVLTAGVAHEINNPLNFIKGGILGLEKLYDTSGNINLSDAPLLLNSVKTGIERIYAIVSSLNQFSRINDNYNEECDVQNIIDNCLVILQNRIKETITIEKHYSNTPYSILGNSGKLHEVFLNILQNSIQAITDRGVVSIVTKILKNMVVIKISDSGCGISKENLSKITDPFFTTKDPGEGTGLGLSIAYSIIKEHKGKLEFCSEENVGTEVDVFLPLKINSNETKT